MTAKKKKVSKYHKLIKIKGNPSFEELLTAAINTPPLPKKKKPVKSKAKKKKDEAKDKP